MLFQDRRILDLDGRAFKRRFSLLLASLRHSRIDYLPEAELIDGDRPGLGFVQHNQAWLEQRLQHLRAKLDGDEITARPLRVGWKEPNTHAVLHRLFEVIPNLKIHSRN